MYFVKKLYRSLKVPTSRLNSDDAFKDGTEILREELKFARFIIRMQQRFAAGIKRGFITHLKLTGMWEKYELAEQHLEVDLNVPTNFYQVREAQALELKSKNYASFANDELISRTYSQKKYLGWSDQDILANREFLRKDTEFKWELEQIAASGPFWKEQAMSAGAGGEGEMAPPGESGLEGGGSMPPDFGGGPAVLGNQPPEEVEPVPEGEPEQGTPQQ
jgi:hypothetical protein